MLWSLLLIALGAALLSVALSQFRLVEHHKALFNSLQVQASQCTEPLDWPSMAWPTLQKAGFLNLAYSGRWFGHSFSNQLGENAHPALAWKTEEVHRSDDILLQSHVSSLPRRGQRKWLAEQTWQLFLIHWRSMLREREKVLDTALVQRAEHALMLKHDLRNFAQWVEWTASEFAQARDNPDLLLASAYRFSNQSEALITRSRSLLARTARKDMNHADPPFDLAAFIQSVATFHGVLAMVEGNGASKTPSDVWEHILDNLFSNLGAEVRQRGIGSPACMTCSTTHVNGDSIIVIRMSMPDGLVFSLKDEQLFEPFTSARPGGLGLGLYLARRQARQFGGDLSAITSPPTFLLQLP
jgi:hypothetical protein